MTRRRFAVKAFGLATGSARAACVFAVGCKHLESAVRVFERKAGEVAPQWSMLLLMDRQEWRVLRSFSLADGGEATEY